MIFEIVPLQVIAIVNEVMQSQTFVTLISNIENPAATSLADNSDQQQFSLTNNLSAYEYLFSFTSFVNIDVFIPLFKSVS